MQTHRGWLSVAAPAGLLGGLFAVLLARVVSLPVGLAYRNVIVEPLVPPPALSCPAVPLTCSAVI